jgi:ABC-type branched-subunit amino acid transport system ATPase component/ABC-type branched-subunit amino acid transport system permease subunit
MIAAIVLGLATGGLYALGSLGVVCIYRGSKVLNLAIGGIATWAGYLFEKARDSWGIPGLPSGALVVLAGAAFGVIAYMLVIRPIRDKTELQKLVMSLALFSTLVGAAQLTFGSQPEIVNSSLPTNAVKLFGTDVGEDRLLILGMALAVAAIVAVWSSRSRIALAMHAVAENERGLVSLGYSPHVVGALSWAVGCALSAFAGVLLAPIVGLSPASLEAIVVPSLAAGLLGRFDSYGWAVVGGLGIGLVESIVTRYVSATGWSSAAPALVIVVALLLRRDRESNRSRVSEGIPLARELPILNLLVLALLAGVALFASTTWITASTTSMCFGILALSLVVIVGYGNQISIAQMAIAGLSALLSAFLMRHLGIPFILVPILGALIGGIVGVLIGIPALRLSGVNLAVTTIALSQAVEQVVFDNNSLNGGYAGIDLKDPKVFGIDVNALIHERAYAWFALFWLIVAALAVLWTRRSGFGRRLLAVRTNERAAAALGVKVARTKVLAFAISSALAGLAGVLLAFTNTNLNVTSGFSYTDSINLIVLALIAGITSTRGGLVGGVLAIGGLFYAAVTHISFVTNNYTLISGVLLMIAVLRHPQGVTYVREREETESDLPTEIMEGPAPEPLTVEGVSVAFGGVKAVSGMSVTVSPGQVVGIVGPNGAGKTTLLDAICGLAPVASGSVVVGARDVSRMNASGRANAGLARVFQGVELFEDLTVAQNLRVPIDAGGWGNKLPSVASEFIARTGLESDFAKLPSALSLGRRKLVAVARALVSNPTVILLDEPAAGVGHGEAAGLGAAIRELADRHGLAVALVDHDLPLVMATSDVVAVMADGALIASGTPAEILANRRVRDAYLGESMVEVSAGVSETLEAEVQADMLAAQSTSAEEPS